ncbi:MAG: hypothetical protein J7501_17665, partial [Bdellovibrio sp.]|nr:hypothetical protein [Bdellovibrio sp.]
MKKSLYIGSLTLIVSLFNFAALAAETHESAASEEFQVKLKPATASASKTAASPEKKAAPKKAAPKKAAPKKAAVKKVAKKAPARTKT